jgi:hypothetical protein
MSSTYLKSQGLVKQLGKINSNDSSKIVKIDPKNQNSFTRHNTKYMFTKRETPRHYKA